MTVSSSNNTTGNAKHWRYTLPRSNSSMVSLSASAVFPCWINNKSNHMKSPLLKMCLQVKQNHGQTDISYQRSEIITNLENEREQSYQNTWKLKWWHTGLTRSLPVWPAYPSFTIVHTFLGVKGLSCLLKCFTSLFLKYVTVLVQKTLM